MSNVSRIYLIGEKSDEDLSAEVVGGKAANLLHLARLRLRVPPALAVTTALSREVVRRGKLPDHVRGSLAGSIRQLEEATGLTLGGRRPLLVSVRSSPTLSMPGMLTTILNAGINEETVHGLIRRTGNPWLAWDVYRRFVRSFSEALQPASAAIFEQETAQHLARVGVRGVQDLEPMAMRDLARSCAALVPSLLHRALPVDPIDQILMSLEAVARSWTSPRASEYRRVNRIDENAGTGVLIQTMVFGNSGALSGSGVGFTRNPADGRRELYIDFAFNAQGEDVVGGRQPVAAASNLLAATLPQVWSELLAATDVLEAEFRDMQDFEFVVEEGKLFFLQTRAGKRTPWAALRIATDLVRERIIQPSLALERLAPYDLEGIGRMVLHPEPGDVPIATATAASDGVATGRVVFDAARAEQFPDGHVILVRPDLTTDDIGGLMAAAGILTKFGGRTSHAAVVARQLGKVCLAGCTALHVDEAAGRCSIGALNLREGDIITLDGENGLIYSGHIPVVTERPIEDLAFVDSWRHRAVTAGSGDQALH